MLHLGATCYMLGLIWFVQVVHYPLMDRVAPPAFPAFEAEHMRRTGLVVAPVMLLELGTALLIVHLRLLPVSLALANLVLLGIIWASTFLVQAPAHRRMRAGFLGPTHRRLVRTNWLRTLLWTLRAVLLLWALGGILLE